MSASLTPAGEEEQNPPNEKGEPSQRRDRPEPAMARHAQKIEASGEDDDPDRKRPPGAARESARAPVGEPGHGKQTESMVEVIANRGLEYGEHLGGQALVERVSPESTESHREKHEEAAETYPEHGAECSPDVEVALRRRRLGGGRRKLVDLQDDYPTFGDLDDAPSLET